MLPRFNAGCRYSTAALERRAFFLCHLVQTTADLVHTVKIFVERQTRLVGSVDKGGADGQRTNQVGYVDRPVIAVITIRQTPIVF